jgi:tetratricopeptide (TPR) repeat protein
MKKTIMIVVCVAVVLAAAFTQYVHRGYVGVTESGGSIRLMDRGLHLRVPWHRVTFYPIQCSSTTIKSFTEGPLGRIEFDLILEMSVCRESVVSLHRSYHGRYVEALLVPLVADLLRRRQDSPGGHAGGRNPMAVDTEMVSNLNASLGEYGINVYRAYLQSFDVVTSPEDDRIRETSEHVGGRVVLLGLDAFDWQIYEAVLRSRPLPNFEKIIAEGATGDLLSMEPLVSPMIWTTMATGVEPTVHGIVDFLMKDVSTGEDVPITSNMRRVPALWNIMTRFGKSSGFVGWLGTYPAEAVNGFMVSDRIGYHIFDPRWQKGSSYGAERDRARSDFEGLTYPDSLIDEIRPLIMDAADVPYETLASFIRVRRNEVAPDAKTFDPFDLPRNLRVTLASNLTFEAIADATYAKYRPQLFSVYLDLTDSVCHLFIKHMEPHTADVSAEDAARFSSAVIQTYAHADSLVGAWLKRIDRNTTLVIVSDHGFKSGDLRPHSASVIGGAQATAWHRMVGAVALYGNHVKPGARIVDARVIDVGPTVLALLGLPKAKDMPGRLLADAFDPEWVLAATQAGEIETYGIRTEVASAPRNKEEEGAILDRLKALGYIGSGPTDMSKLAHSYFMQGEFDKAVEIWEEILAKEPDNMVVMVSMAHALIEKGDLDRAYLVLRDANKRNPGYLPAQNVLALYHINVGHLDEAARISERVIAKDPNDAEAYFNLGVVLDQQGYNDQALAAFRRSVDLRGDFDQSRINLGNTLMRKGDVAEARIQFERALEIDPSGPDAWYAMGRLLQMTGKVQDAVTYYREALKRAPAFNPARINLAIVFASGGDMGQAKRELEAGLQYPFDLAAINTNIGILERRMGDPGAAEGHLKRAIETDPQYLPARLDLADLYVSQGRQGDARRELEAILKIDPANAEARRVLLNLR